MKKLLISILAVILGVLVYILTFKNVSIAGWTSKNFNDMKLINDELTNQINIAKQTNNQDYPQAVEELEQSIKNLKIAKEKYETKINSLSQDVELGVIEIKQYKIERLWVVLANYAKDRNVELVLDLVESNASATEQNGIKIYDLNITLVGEYIGITDFIYDIENDDTLNFKILNFKLVPNVLATVNNTTSGNTTSTESNKNTQTTTYTVDNGLKATFKVEDIGINLE